MHRHRMRVLSLLALLSALAGCELIADFDRGKLDASASDGAAEDAGAPDNPQ